VTNFVRKDLKEAAATRADSINSFCITPDGNILFHLTEHDEQGSLYSICSLNRLTTSRAASPASHRQRYWDTLRPISPMTAATSGLRFQSERPGQARCFSRQPHRTTGSSGGISRLTNGLAFNFAPTYGDSNRQLFYLSVEPNFPLADFQVQQHQVRMDRYRPSCRSVRIEINNTFAEKVFFVKIDDDTKKETDLFDHGRGASSRRL